MAEYSSNDWVAGNIVTAAKLNNMEGSFQKGSSNYGYKRYTTGTDTTMFATATTYIATANSTLSGASMLTFQIPNYVERSKVDFTITVSACSSFAGTPYLWLVAGRHAPSFLYPIQYGTYVPNMLIQITPSTTPTVSSTMLTITGGESFTVVFECTMAAAVKFYDLKITGVEATYNPISNAWGTIYSTSLV